MLSLWIDGGSAYTGGEVGGWVDVKEELLLERDEEDVIGVAVVLDTAGHADEREGHWCNEDFGELGTEIG
jgi:pyruvate-formate lyase-activating enzyme